MSGQEEEIAPSNPVTEFSARHFEMLARSLGLLVVFLDPELEISYISQEAAALLSGGVEDEFRRSWREGLQDRVKQLLVREDRPEVDIEIFLEPDDGVFQSCLLRVVSIDETDCRGYLALVTPGKAAEAARDALRLASRMENLARFFRSYVHDLKAPLNAMVLAVQALRVKIAPRDGEESSPEVRYLETLKAEVERLERMLARLLEETAPDSNEGEAEYHLVAQLQDIVSFLRPLASDSRVSIELDVPAGEELRMLADPDRVKQVLVNLAMNALEAMPDGGTLTLAVAEENGEYRLRVDDTGKGIPDELLRRIWSVHFTTKEKGTGIGLTVVRSVVETLGGTVRARRLEPGGMRFEVAFPPSRLRRV